MKKQPRYAVGSTVQRIGGSRLWWAGSVYTTPIPVKIIRWLKTKGYLVEYGDGVRKWADEEVLALPDEVAQRTEELRACHRDGEANFQRVSDEIGPIRLTIPVAVRPR